MRRRAVTALAMCALAGCAAREVVPDAEAHPDREAMVAGLRARWLARAQELAEQGDDAVRIDAALRAVARAWLTARNPEAAAPALARLRDVEHPEALELRARVECAALPSEAGRPATAQPRTLSERAASRPTVDLPPEVIVEGCAWAGRIPAAIAAAEELTNGEARARAVGLILASAQQQLGPIAELQHWAGEYSRSTEPPSMRIRALIPWARLEPPGRSEAVLAELGEALAASARHPNAAWRYAAVREASAAASALGLRGRPRTARALLDLARPVASGIPDAVYRARAAIPWLEASLDLNTDEASAEAIERHRREIDDLEEPLERASLAVSLAWLAARGATDAVAERAAGAATKAVEAAPAGAQRDALRARLIAVQAHRGRFAAAEKLLADMPRGRARDGATAALARKQADAGEADHAWTTAGQIESEAVRVEALVAVTSALGVAALERLPDVLASESPAARASVWLGVTMTPRACPEAAPCLQQARKALGALPPDARDALRREWIDAELRAGDLRGALAAAEGASAPTSRAELLSHLAESLRLADDAALLEVWETRP